MRLTPRKSQQLAQYTAVKLHDAIGQKTWEQRNGLGVAPMIAMVAMMVIMESVPVPQAEWCHCSWRSFVAKSISIMPSVLFSICIKLFSICHLGPPWILANTVEPLLASLFKLRFNCMDASPHVPDDCSPNPPGELHACSDNWFTHRTSTILLPSTSVPFFFCETLTNGKQQRATLTSSTMPISKQQKHIGAGHGPAARNLRRSPPCP